MGGATGAGFPAGSDVGTGAAHTASEMTNVTGGGPMPNWLGDVVQASCTGDGVADDTECLQAAADQARDQQKPLVIPASSAFYRTTQRITVYGSVGGVGGRPTLRSDAACGTGACGNLVLAPGFSGWIYNLHLVGTYELGGETSGEWAHNIDIGSVTGVTIRSNLLENPMGDSMSNDSARFDGGSQTANDVIVAGNTLRNPRRCAIGFVYDASGWVVIDNVIEKQNNYVSGIDYEPEVDQDGGPGHVADVEIAFNQFIMDNRTVNPERGADGKATFGWGVPDNGWPGDHIVEHHNYGTFGTGFWDKGGNFTNVSVHSNEEGPSPAP